jgi:hypothetical protein
MQPISDANQRAIHIMDRISKVEGITRSAEIGLIQLVNPFADFEMQKVGYYDTNESSSVVFAVRYAKTFGAPPGLPSGANWDFHLFTTPFTNTLPSGPQPAVLVAGGLLYFNDPGVVYDVGGVVAMSGSSGAPLNLTNVTAPGVLTCSSKGLVPQLGQLYTDAEEPGTDPLDGEARVIAWGFEVHNTTSPLNSQGAVAVYRMPQYTMFDRQTVNVCQVDAPLAPTTAAFTGSASVACMQDVPGSLAEVMLLNGSKQWEAKDGCMCIPTLADVNIQAQRLSNVVPMSIAQTAPVDLTGIDGNAPGPLAGYTGAVCSIGGSLSGYAANIDNPNTSIIAFDSVPRVHVNNFNTAGAYFTGLSNPSTLTVNVIMYIEKFTTQADKALVNLANPSPPYSSRAMELYPEMLRFLPVGVPVCDNADGDWFFQAVKSVSDFLTKPLQAVGGAIGIGGSLLTGAASSWAAGQLAKNNAENKALQREKQVAEAAAQKALAKVEKSVAGQMVRQEPGPRRPPGFKRADWASLTLEQKKKVVKKAARAAKVAAKS